MFVGPLAPEAPRTAPAPVSAGRAAVTERLEDLAQAPVRLIDAEARPAASPAEDCSVEAGS